MKVVRFRSFCNAATAKMESNDYECCNLFSGDKILREITETVQLRHDAELRRAELVQRANDLQMRVKEKRDKINRVRAFLFTVK